MVIKLDVLLCGTHCDFMGIPIPVRLLEFLEQGRWDAFGRHMLGLRESGLDFVIVNQNVDFSLRPIQTGRHLQVHTSIARFGKRTLVLLQELWDPELDYYLCSAQVSNCLLEASTGKATQMTDELKQRFAYMTPEAQLV